MTEGVEHPGGGDQGEPGDKSGLEDLGEIGNEDANPDANPVQDRSATIRFTYNIGMYPLSITVIYFMLSKIAIVQLSSYISIR